MSAWLEGRGFYCLAHLELSSAGFLEEVTVRAHDDLVNLPLPALAPDDEVAKFWVLEHAAHIGQ